VLFDSSENCGFADPYDASDCVTTRAIVERREPFLRRAMNMARSLLFVTAAALLALGAAGAMADDVKYSEEDGLTYRETTQTIQRPVQHTTMQQRDVTYNRERYTTELQEVQRTYQVPITEYVWKPETHRSWNPFEPPYVAYRMVQQTRYETRSETVKIPVAKREVVPEKITQQVPVTTQRIAQEKVVTKVAIGPAGSHATGGASTMAAGGANNLGNSAMASSGAGSTNDGMGGMAKLDTDPPKQSIDWRQGDATARK
jgi:hypothetical protein